MASFLINKIARASKKIVRNSFESNYTVELKKKYIPTQYTVVFTQKQTAMYKTAIVLLLTYHCVYVKQISALSPQMHYDLREAPRYYDEYIKDFHKTFKDQNEYRRRYKNFVETLKKINTLNAQPGGNKVKLNSNSDLTDAERKPRKIDPELKSIMRIGRPRLSDLFVTI